MKKQKPLKIIEVHWLDSLAPYKIWNHKDSVSEFTCGHPHSIGYFVRKTSKVLTLAQSFDPTVDNYGAIVNIPICSITKMRTIR